MALSRSEVIREFGRRLAAADPGADVHLEAGLMGVIARSCAQPGYTINQATARADGMAVAAGIMLDVIDHLERTT